jgi:hypothetical protein
MKLRPPATPLITHDPYFSVWYQASPFKNIVHWTGHHNNIFGKAFVDDKEYHFLGKALNAVNMTLEKTELDAFSTIVTYTCDEIRLTAHFTSPVLITDLYLSSRPVSWCKITWEALDGKAHDVRVKFFFSEEFVLNLKGEGRAWSESCTVEGATAVRMGNGEQNTVWRSGDNLRIDWGYLYIGAQGEASVGNCAIQGMYGIWVEKKVENEALFFFAYDDIESIVYFGDKLKAYWKKDNKTIEEAISESLVEYDRVLARCNEFSEKLRIDAEKAGGEEYADMLILAYRQVMAGHKLVVDTEGNNLYISKECFSNGCAATVDVTYPSSPLYLVYNTELLKGMLRPIMKYAASEAWKFDFAPHDVGQYPLLNGQVYNTDSLAGQMPVEECGNMIILFAAICDRDGNADFVKPYLDTVKSWSEYLIKYGLDPENQLCTDDFAGHLAHNVNLSIKAIMGIAGYAKILSFAGEKTKSEEMMKIAREYADSVMKRSLNSDGSYRLAFDKPDTFSLKYNSVWDKIWNTELFTKEFYNGETARYIKELLPYGVPLDSREKYTKSDWLVWASCLAESREDSDTIIHSLWSAYNTMRTYVPMGDWYWCDTSTPVMFQHRTVQGGLFIKLMM